MKRVTLLHPFSARAIGLKEEDLYYSHSKPHEKALHQIQTNSLKVSIDYFTGNIFLFTKNISDIKKNFWPISSPLLKNRHKWRSQYSFYHYVKNIINPSDLTIINMSGHGSKYIFKLAKLLNRKNKPYIAMIGGLHMSTNGEALKYYQNAHHIIVHTDLQKKELLTNEGFKKLDIRVLPLGVDTNLFKASVEKKNKDINLLFVGRISRLKQIELIIKTVSELKNNQQKEVYLKIIGPVSDSVYCKELTDLITQLQLSSNVTFTGLIEQEKLIPYFQKADLLLLPSAHESFGMVMIEAMACGTPVAALKNSGGPEEIIVDGFNGVLSDTNTYCKDIIKFFNSTEKRIDLSKNSKITVNKKFSIELTTKLLRKSVEDALT